MFYEFFAGRNRKYKEIQDKNNKSEHIYSSLHVSAIFAGRFELRFFFQILCISDNGPIQQSQLLIFWVATFTFFWLAFCVNCISLKIRAVSK